MSDPTSRADGQADPTEPAAYPPPAYAPPNVSYHPMPPAAKKNHTGLIVGIVGGGVLLALIIAGAIVFALQSAAHTPQKAVDAYLRSIVHGDVKQALALGNVKVTASDLLLTSAAYRASTNHITHYSIAGSAINGDGAAVTARITQGTQSYAQSFALVKDGKDLLFFDRWELKPVTLGTATVQIDAPSDATFTIADAAITGGSNAISLRALPGTYPVTMSGSSTLYEAKESSADVIGFSSASSKPAQMTAVLTDAGMKSATAAVNAYVDGCAASTDFRPVGCSFGATGENDSYTYSHQKWTIDPRPVFAIGSWVAGGWAVTTTTPGVANFSADISDGSGGTGTATAGPIEVRVTGYISKIDDTGATFDPLVTEDPTA